MSYEIDPPHDVPTNPRMKPDFDDRFRYRRRLLQLISWSGLSLGVLGCSSKSNLGSQNSAEIASDALPVSQFAMTKTSEGASPLQPTSYEIEIGGNWIESHRHWPAITLTNQKNQTVDFYRDVIANRCVVLNFFYTRCTGNCPVTMGRMIKLAKYASSLEQGNVQFLSVSLDSERETAQDLANYAKAVLPKESNWQLFCGDGMNVERLRRYLGFYEIDEATDAIPRSHASMVLFGNDETHRWLTLPAISSFRQWRSVLSRVES